MLPVKERLGSLKYIHKFLREGGGVTRGGDKYVHYAKKCHFKKAKGLNTFVAYCSLHAHKHIFF